MLSGIRWSLPGAFCLAILGTGCESPVEEIPAEAITELTVDDVTNTGTGEDLEVSFNRLFDNASLKEYRLLAVKSSSASAFGVSEADAAAVDQYVSVSNFLAKAVARFTAESRDMDGDLIRDGVPYKVFVLTVADGAITNTNALSEASTEITLGVTNLVVTVTTDIPIGSGGLDVDDAGFIYAADFGTALSGGTIGTKIYKISPSGEFNLWASGLIGASGNEFDSKGNLFQSNIGANSISKITPGGSVSTFLSSNNGLSAPVGIVADPMDTLYVCNCGSQSIQKVTPDGISSRFVSNPLGLLRCPNGITMDPAGNLYVANFGNGDVIKITPTGIQSVLVTLPGNNNGHLLYANGVLYVVARGVNQIYEVTLSGEVSLLAGSGARGLKDGSALQATLSLTNDVAISPDGKNLYFNDVVNLSGTNILAPVRVRKVVLDAL